MSKKQIAVVVAFVLLFVLVGIVIPMADQADALAPVDQALDHFLYHLNQIPY